MTIGREAGLDAVGVATAAPFTSVRRVLEQRRRDGLHAGMQFTYRNPTRSTDPSRSLAGARCLIVGALRYGVPVVDAPEGPAGRVAAYATDDHYARLRSALEVVAAVLRDRGWRALVSADQNALVDRAAAHRAGLGWWGRSTNILVPGAGSTVVLGSVVTDAPVVDRDPAPVADGCGSCRRCLDACPTGALVAPGVLDARRCLAWIVQAPGVIEHRWRDALGDRIYGCDDCQDVCPPNRLPRAAVTRGDVASPGPPAQGRWVDVVALLEADDDTLMRRHGRWYVADRDPAHLRRNALVVLANTAGRRDLTDPRLVAVLRRHLADDRALVRAHAVWAVRRLGLDELLTDLVGDDDPLVAAELTASVAVRADLAGAARDGRGGRVPGGRQRDRDH